MIPHWQSSAASNSSYPSLWPLNHSSASFISCLDATAGAILPHPNFFFSTTFSSVSPSLSSAHPFHSTKRITHFPTMEKLLPLFIWLRQRLSQLMLNLCGYINDRHCPWMGCAFFSYIYHPHRLSILLRVALSLV